MNKETSIVLIIVSALVFLVLGGGMGFWYKTLQTLPQTVQIEKTTALIKDLSSKIIISTVAYGRVVKIEGKSITLSYNGDSLKINIAGNSTVNAFVLDDATKKQVQKKVDFSEIKVGDDVNIIIKFLPDGQIQGQSVLILLSKTKF